MKKTGIDWTDYSWNPWQGCKKISPACDNCYMFTDKKRYGQKGSDIHRSAKATFNKPLKIEAGSKVFTCSWSDFFLEEADEWRDEAWDIIRKTPHLIYQILTKRPENIKDRLPEDWEENFGHVWLGVTAENQEQADLRIPILLDTPTSKRFVSVEPMLEGVDITKIKYFRHIDWVIVGGESGEKAKTREMKPEWVKKIYDDCQFTVPWSGIAFFFKQWGTHKPKDIGSYDFEKVQEFPAIADMV